MSRKLFVGNIPFQTSEDELQNLFAQAGPVESVRVMRDNATGRARGFAFVEMQTEEGASAAIDQFNQYQLGGRTLAVNEARPMAPRPGGGRFDGGGGRGDRGRGRSEPRW